MTNICFYYKLRRYFLENEGKVQKQTLATIGGGVRKLEEKMF